MLYECSCSLVEESESETITRREDRMRSVTVVEAWMQKSSCLLTCLFFWRGSVFFDVVSTFWHYCTVYERPTHTVSLHSSLTLVTTCRGRWSATITTLRVFGEDLAVLVREITGFFESSILRLWDIDLCSHSMYSKVDIIPPQDSTPNRTRQVELIQWRLDCSSSWRYSTGSTNFPPSVFVNIESNNNHEVLLRYTTLVQPSDKQSCLCRSTKNIPIVDGAARCNWSRCCGHCRWFHRWTTKEVSSGT